MRNVSHTRQESPGFSRGEEVKVRGIVQFIQRTSVGQISIILRDTDTIKFVIYTPVRERRKYMFSYHVEGRFHWTKKPKGSSATRTIVDD